MPSLLRRFHPLAAALILGIAVVLIGISRGRLGWEPARAQLPAGQCADEKVRPSSRQRVQLDGG